IVRGGAGECRLNILPTAYVRPERIPQGHVICQRVQRLENFRVAFQYRPEGRVALFDCAGEVVCGHLTSPFRWGLFRFAKWGMSHGARRQSRSASRLITAPHVHVIQTRSPSTPPSSSPQYWCSWKKAQSAAKSITPV